MTARHDAVAAIAAWLRSTSLDHERPDDHTFVIVLPGDRKQRITTTVQVGEHYATVQAFVARSPEENVDDVHRWLLERNRSLYAVAYCIDHLGDIYLSGRLPLHAITEDECDRVLGTVLAEADGSFNTIVGMGFASAITREWQWRLDRGESTANLEAFPHLRPEA